MASIARCASSAPGACPWSSGRAPTSLPGSSPMSRRGTAPGMRPCSTGHSTALTAGYRAARRFLTESLVDTGIQRAQRHGFGTFGAAGAALRVPCHPVEMRPRDIGLDKFLQVERRGHRTGIWRIRDVVEVGDLAVDHLAV